jgi:farnesyl diphosphate synthase
LQIVLISAHRIAVATPAGYTGCGPTSEDWDCVLFAERVELRRNAVEKRLRHLLGDVRGAPLAPVRLAEAMRYATLGGGKRFRPYLVIEAAALFGVTEQQALDTAAAIECIHCYSLVHDDLPAMDDDDLRRGRPTVHKAFDEATAILAGDGLLTIAFEILSAPAAHPDPAIRAQLVLGLARASGWRGMAGGQMLDLEAEGVLQDTAGIRRIQALKTGALIEFSVDAGAILGCASAPEREALQAYARAVGLAFQTGDDLLDAEGSPEQIGKTTGKDAGAGKATFVSLLGISGAHETLRALGSEAVAALKVFGRRGANLEEAAHFVTSRRS